VRQASFKDLTGQRFGLLVALSYDRGYWTCVCDCGNAHVVYGSNLRKGFTRSCGCLRKRSTPLEIRFWRFVNKEPGPCWIWTGAHSELGYGNVNTGLPKSNPKRTKLAHRVSYELAYGALADDAYVLHKCDTPACVNPEHLFVGDHTDNMRDMARKGRGRTPGKTLSFEAVTEIRAAARAGESHRSIACRFDVAKTTIGAIIRGRRRLTS